MNIETTAKINGMTHRQLVRFARQINLKLGDYMKLSKDEIASRVLACCAWETDAAINAHFECAFPQGLFVKGKRRFAGNIDTSTGTIQTASEGATEAKPAKVIPSIPGDAANQLADLIAQLTAPQNATIDAEAVKAIVQAELAGLVLPVTVQLRDTDGTTTKLDGLHHRRFPDLLAKVQAGVNVWLAGPAGTGKTTSAQNVAKALGLPFYFNGAIDNEYKLLGFTDAQGRIVSRPFRKAFCEGGVYLFDEVDASMPAALLPFNAAMANGHCDFPDGCFEKHKNFRAIAAANTYGQGATADYVGRSRMDGAFLDRFVMQQWEIDETLERAIAGNDKWVTYVQDVRRKVAAKGIKIIISPRASIHGAKMLACGIDWAECQNSCLRRGMSDEQWAGVR